jgi:hypothetical protein
LTKLRRCIIFLSVELALRKQRCAFGEPARFGITQVYRLNEDALSCAFGQPMRFGIARVYQLTEGTLLSDAGFYYPAFLVPGLLL